MNTTKIQKNILACLIIAIFTTTSMISQTSLNFNFNNLNNGRYSDNQFKSDFKSSKGLNKNGRNNLTIQNKTLRSKLPKRKVFDGGTILNIPIKGSNKYTLSYKIKFENGFEFKKGGKLPGLSGGAAYSGGNGRARTKGDGWSFRLMWRHYNKANAGSDIRNNGKPYIEPYVYYKDMPAGSSIDKTYGHDFNKKYTIKAGVWYTIKMTLVMNTGSSKNGNFKVTINNTVMANEKIRWGTTNRGRTIDKLAWHTFRGGPNSSQWVTNKDEYVYYDDVKLSGSDHNTTTTKPTVTKPPVTNPNPVVNNNAPQVSFAKPGNLTVNEGDKVSIEVNAKDKDGISGVKLYIDGKFIREDKSAKYNWGHKGSPNPNEINERLVSGKTHTIKAVARDKKGKERQVTKTIYVRKKQVRNRPPEISFVKPTAYAVNEGEQVSIEVNAKDSDGISGVKLYIDGTFIREEKLAKYTWGYGVSSKPNEINERLKPGKTHVIKAVARDKKGAENSTSIQLTVKSKTVKKTNNGKLIQDAFLAYGKRNNSQELRVESGNKRITYLLFDLSNIKGNVTKASLNLTVASDEGKGKIKVYQSLQTNWKETNLSNSNKPKNRTYLASLTSTYKKGNTYTWDLKGLQVGRKVSLIIEQSGKGANDVSFWSKEGKNKPVLKIESKSNSSKASIIDDITILENKKQDVVVYPNPAHEVLYLSELPGSVNQIDVYGIHGQRVISNTMQKTEGTIEVDLNELAKGIYFVKINSTDDEAVTKRFIKN